mgnify:CR=1 FL=1
MRLKLFITTLLVTLGMSAGAKDYKYQTVEGDLMKTRIYTLDNGLKVYLSVNDDAPRIQTYIAVRTGSRNDPAETTGLAHYLEHIMFKGTTNFGTSDYAKEKPLLDDIEARYEKYRKLTDPQERKNAYHEIDSISQIAAQYFIPNEYDKLMASIGAEGTNAYTSNDVTCYTEDIPSNEVENWLKVESDRFRNMVIRGFHTELEAVYEEFNIGLAKDNRKAYNALFALAMPGHPYGTQTTIGTQEHLKNPSITNIKNYFNRYYVPNNVAICMAGDFNPDAVIALIDKYFGSWQPNKNLSRPEYPALKPITEIKDTTVVGQEAENIMMAWRFNGASDLQSDTLEVISYMLANGKAGLFEVNLEQKMLAQGVSAFNYGLNDYSGLVINGMPKDNQSLEELRALILGEIGKLKRGEFSDDLLPAVINNMKLNHYKGLKSNEYRADAFVDAFINGKRWEDVVAQYDRRSGMTKQQIVDFANKYLNDNFVCVYKKIGNDTTIHKIDKPAITPIPTNRDMSSKFLEEIMSSKTEEIQPRFIDFKKDMAISKIKNLPLLYKHNDEDGLFNLSFYYNFGTEAQKSLDLVPSYLYYIGTDKKTSAEIKEEFYKLACNYSINVSSDAMTVNLSGLNENLPKALALLEDFMKNAKGDKESYSKFVDLTMKGRADDKTNQNRNFSMLIQYGMYGPYNQYRNILSEKELRDADPQMLPDMLKQLAGMEHTVMYYGPYTEKQLAALITKEHKTAKKLVPAPAGKEYTEQQTPSNEVYIAPYDAKNIYMIQYHNDNRQWNPEEAPVKAMFNQYFGGGMNTVVFQELREARGLAYSAAAYYNEPWRKNHPEDFYTYIISQNDKMMDCIKVFNNIIDTIPQSQAAFDIAKQSLAKSLQSQRTLRFGILNAYMSAKRRGIDYDINEKIYNALPSIKLSDIVKFEQDNMAHKPYRYIILGDEKELDMEALGKIGPIKRLTTEEIFGY